MRTTDEEFEHVTTEETVAVYEASHPVFEGLMREVRELSKKKGSIPLTQVSGSFYEGV